MPQKTSGQSLPEYAIIIALVAIVVAVIIGLVGIATKRGFGVVAGALGAKHNETSSSGNRIEILSAQCLASISQNKVGVWVIGITNIPLGEVTGSTDLGLFSTVTDHGGGQFRYNPLITGSADLGKCPKSVVIQGSDGTTAVSPLSASTVP